MDYSYFAPPAQPYQFFTLPEKPGHPYTPHDDLQHDPLEIFNDPNAFHLWDHSGQFGATNIIPPPPQSPPHSLHRPSISNMLPFDHSNSMSTEAGGEAEFEQAQGRSSDEDKDNLTPAQSRRKAQNRAAQRAFRERKERHVKDLELKLKSIEARSTDLLSDNERLKRELDRLATQNEILRATTTPVNLSNPPRQPHTPHLPHHHSNEDPDGHQAEVDNITYSSASFNAALHSAIGSHQSNPDEPVSRRTFKSATGERLLSTGAAWDLIQNHELVRRGLVDLPEVVDRLRERVECDGAGPTVPEAEVLKAIEESVGGGGGDELI